MRPTTGGSPRAQRARARRRHRDRATAHDRALSSSSGSAPPPTFGRSLRDHVAAATPSAQPLGARPQLLLAGLEHAEHRELGAAPRRVAVEPQRRLERRERQLVDAQRARQRMRAAALDRSALADHQARLRAAEQLVAGEADDGGARRDERRTGGSSASSGTPLGSAPEPTSSITGTREAAHSSSIATSSVKPTMRKFDWCARMIAPVLLAERPRVVGQARAVGRADLDEARARRAHDVGDAERAADLHQLTARDDDLAPAGERRRARAARRRRSC